MKLKGFKNHFIDWQRIQLFFKATEVWSFSFLNLCVSLTKFHWMKRIILLSNIYGPLCFPDEQKERLSNDWSPTSPNSVEVFCHPTAHAIVCITAFFGSTSQKLCCWVDSFILMTCGKRRKQEFLSLSS